MNTGRPKMDRIIVPILGIRVDSTSISSVLIQLQVLLKRRNYSLVVTPNPEIIIQAMHDHDLARIINKADLSLPDGIGVVWAMKFLYNIKSELVPGRIVFKSLLALAAREGLRVFLVGGRDGVAEQLADKLKNSGEMKIQGATGPWLNGQGKPINLSQYQVEKDLVKRINSFAPDFLFVGFGPPKQEKWLARNLPHLKVKVGMVVGGAFDYYAGKYPLPPKFLERAGLEWFWRLLTQPYRIKRIFTAVVVFPWRVFLQRLKNIQ